MLFGASNMITGNAIIKIVIPRATDVSAQDLRASRDHFLGLCCLPHGVGGFLVLATSSDYLPRALDKGGLTFVVREKLTFLWQRRRGSGIIT